MNLCFYSFQKGADKLLVFYLIFPYYAAIKDRRFSLPKQSARMKNIKIK